MTDRQTPNDSSMNHQHQIASSSYLETLILAQEASSSGGNPLGDPLKLGPQFLTSSPQVHSNSSSGGSGSGSISSNISASFLLNLANGTFVSLPILQCFSGGQNLPDPTRTPGELTISNKTNNFDLCSINWTDVRLFGGSIAGGLADLYPLVDHWPPAAPFKFNEHQPTAGPPATTTTTSSSQLHHYTRLTYLTLSSILSLAGVLTNLLTGLILLVNTKQKFCNHFLSSRNSNTNHHYVLLSQLTLTGLLIASYVLVDSVQTYTYSSDNFLDLKSIDGERYLDSLNHQYDYIRAQATYYDHDCNFDRRRLQLCNREGTSPPSTADHTTNYNDLSRLISISSLWEEDFDSTRVMSDSIIEIDDSLLRLDFRRAKYRPKLKGRNPMQVYLRVDQDNRGEVAAALLPPTVNSHKLFDLSQILDSIDVIPNPFPNGQQHENRNYYEKKFGGHAAAAAAAAGPDPMGLLVNLLGTIHIWTVAALAYDRYCAIAHPLQYLRSISTFRARIFLLILWTLALLVNIVLPFALIRLPNSSRQDIRNDIVPADHHDDPTSEGLSNRSTGGSSFVPDIDPHHHHHHHHHHRDYSSPPTGGASIVLLIISLISLVVVTVIPLIIVTICDISIYGIVKVHERRLSASSSSQGASSTAGCHVNINGTRYYKRHELMVGGGGGGGSEDTRSDTYSVASSILGKLVRASAQVGLLRSISKQDIHQQHQHQHHLDHQVEADRRTEAYAEACQLMLACQAGCCICDSDQSSSRHKQPSQQPTIEATKVINRATRRQLAARQDSYTLMLKRQQQQYRSNIRSSENSNLLLETTKQSDGKPSEQTGPTNNSSNRIKLKRKLSDHHGHQLSFGPRKSSLTSQSDNFNPTPTKQQQQQQQLVRDNLEIFDPPCHPMLSGGTNKCLQPKPQQQQHCDSDGIMHQLKMAGLSFAGIAINDSLSSTTTNASGPNHNHYHQHRRSNPRLNRSSSCSLGNLASMRPALNPIPNQPQQQQQSAGSISRCSVETSDSSQVAGGGGQQPNQTGIKRLFSNRTRSQPQSLYNDKSANLPVGDNVDFLPSIDNPPPTPQHNSNRLLPFTIGTKSVSFNVVIWLVLSMLLVILCQCFLHMSLDMLRLFSSNSDRNNSTSLHSSKILDLLVQHLRQQHVATPVADHAESGTYHKIQTVLGWLSCTCRLLFMIMLSMNGWIYGIRSRSLKAALKLVLRRYISRRQASIEIDQRQKSNSSLRSRESSYFNLPYCNHLVSAPFMVANQLEQHEYSPNHHRCHCQCHHHHHHPHSYQNYTHHHQFQHRQPNNNNSNFNSNQSRKFRRCSSFNGMMERDSIHSMNAICEINGGKQLLEFDGNFESDHQWDTNKSDQLTTTQRATGNHGGGSRSHHNNNSIRFVLGDPSDSDPNKSDQPPNNTSVTSSLAGSNKSLLTASIQSSVQSAAFLLLDKRQLEQTSLFKGQQQLDQGPGVKAGANVTKLSGCLKKNHVEFGTETSRTINRTPTRRRRLSSNAFIDRTSSLDRYDEQSTASKNERTNSLLRDHQRPNSSATSYTRKIDGTGGCGPYDRGQADPALQGGDDNTTRLRKSSSEIKFLLTNVDQNVESCVLEVELPTRQVPPETPDPEQDYVSPLLVDDQDPPGGCILVTNINGKAVSNVIQPSSGGPQHKPVCMADSRTSNSLLADCYRQIKTKLTKYVAKSSSNETRRTTDQHSAYSSSCLGSQLTVGNSLPDSPGSCSTTTSSIVAVHVGAEAPTRRSSANGSNDVDFIGSIQCRNNNERLLFRKYSDSSTGTNRSTYEQRSVSGGRVNIHRKSSLDSHYVNPLWRASSGGNSDDSSYPDPNSITKKTAIRNSMTSSNLVAKSINENRSSIKPLCKHTSDHNICDHTKDHRRNNASASNSSYQSGPHLKPPNFLKLMFDTEVHNGLYSSQLALSPIKECSSNHSYASSQSSLSNNQIVQLHQHQKQQQEQLQQKQTSNQQVHQQVDGDPDGKAANYEHQWKPSIVIGDSN